MSKRKEDAQKQAPEGKKPKVDDDEIIILSKQKKPDFKLPSSSLRNRLQSFLPELASANEKLSTTDSLEHVKEEEEHVSMDLGLGVLEEQSSDSSDEEVLAKLKGTPVKSKTIQEVG